MPCFDKKLEASRSDFYMNEAETREVDCVITSGTVITLLSDTLVHLQHPHGYLSVLTGEVQKMLEEHNISLNDVEPGTLDSM